MVHVGEEQPRNDGKLNNDQPDAVASRLPLREFFYPSSIRHRIRSLK
jgi:hypothetical protein